MVDLLVLELVTCEQVRRWIYVAKMVRKSSISGEMVHMSLSLLRLAHNIISLVYD